MPDFRIAAAVFLPAFAIPPALQAHEVPESLRDSLTLHATFDAGVDADFARGDARLHTEVAREPERRSEPGLHTGEATTLVSGKGLSGGGALEFTRRDAKWIFFPGPGNVSYAEADWAGAVSFWLRVDPQKELEPGYCDPVQITTRAWNDGAFFVDFDKEGDPRDFRLGVFPDLEVWNPEKEEIPEDRRPLLKVADPPFGGDRWTHVAFTWEGFNNGDKGGTARFYLDGEPRGEIAGWEQTFTWAADEELRILLGLNYTGLLDELTCYDRALSEAEIGLLHRAGAADAAGAPIVAGTGPGWRTLGEEDFVNVNCDPDTWTWEGATARCTGKPVGVIRTHQQLRNFELVAEWMHLRSGGNSGVFVWATPESIKSLEAGKGRLPHGIEVQVLDLGYTELYEMQYEKKADWFTCHGDVFPTGPAKMTPFPPVAPNGKRSFPSKNLTRGINEWNHYYVRCVNGEVRLWVNGEEVSGGTGCDPSSGYLCLESEGSPVVFRNVRLRELP